MVQAQGGTTILRSTTRQLLRRLNGLQPKQWNLQEDRELLEHLETACSLEVLHDVSGCMPRMTQHIANIFEHKGAQQYGHTLPYLLKPLLPVLSFGLQQLGAGLQQYLSSGQLPAALTRQVVDSIIALCQLLCQMCEHCWYFKKWDGAHLDLALVAHVRTTGRLGH
jgi:hypothetical protein